MTVWDEINARPDRIRRAFGSALSRRVRLALITQPTAKITHPELRKEIDGESNDSTS